MIAFLSFDFRFVIDAACNEVAAQSIAVMVEIIKADFDKARSNLRHKFCEYLGAAKLVPYRMFRQFASLDKAERGGSPATPSA